MFTIISKKIKIQALIFNAVLSFCLFFMFDTSSANSAETKKIMDQFFFGVGMHLGQQWNKTYKSPQDVKSILSDLSVNATRDDLPWGILDAHSQDDLPNAIGKMGDGLDIISARPVIILKGYPKELPGIQPTSEAEREKYTNMAQHAATLLKNYNPIFEIWNEWNLKVRENTQLGSVEQYLELVKAAYPAIKKEIPNGTVLVGGAGDDKNWRWILKAIEMGLMDYGDGISVHPYNYCSRLSPRTGWNVLYSVKTLHRELKKAYPDKDILIYITEIGWPDTDGECGGVSLDIIAENVAQILLEAPALPWLKGIWIYELLDQGTDPTDREDHFGLYDYNKNKKPAACAAKTVWQFIDETTSPKIQNPYWKANFAIYDLNKETKRVAIWDMATTTIPRWVKFPATTKFTSLCGRSIPKTETWYKMESAPILAEIPSVDLSLIKFKQAIIP